MLETRSAYGYYGVAGGTTGETEPEGGWVGEYRRMPYRYYKQRYPDCRTVPGSYDSSDKTIEVIVPEGRDKPSGVRGEHFHYFRYAAEDEDGTILRLPYKAITAENAMKQHIRFCKQNGLKNIEKSS